MVSRRPDAGLRIVASHRVSGGTYGSPRVAAEPARRWRRGERRTRGNDHGRHGGCGNQPSCVHGCHHDRVTTRPPSRRTWVASP